MVRWSNYWQDWEWVRWMLGIRLPDMNMQALYSSVGELFKHWFAALFHFTWLSYITTLPWGMLMRWRRGGRWGNGEEKMKERMNNLKAYSHQCEYSLQIFRGQMLNKNTRFLWACEYPGVNSSAANLTHLGFFAKRLFVFDWPIW